MKKLFLLSLLFPFVSSAQTENALLWKITKKGNKHVSYLFGTIHSNDSLINTFDKTWWKAFQSCSMVAGEVNSTDTQEMMSALQDGMMVDTSLSDLYTEEEFARVQGFILSHLDPMSAMVVGRLKPFYIMAAMMEAPKEDSPYKLVMDLRLQALASEKGMKVIGLESSKEQASSIGVIGLKEQAKMLLEYVDSFDDMSKGLEDAEKFYHQQDLKKLAAMEDELPVSDVLMTSIVDGRNARFIENLLPHLLEENVFCAVGALHLSGEKGMIALLQKEGYKLTPVKFEFKQ